MQTQSDTGGSEGCGQSRGLAVLLRIERKSATSLVEALNADPCCCLKVSLKLGMACTPIVTSNSIATKRAITQLCQRSIMHRR